MREPVGITGTVTHGGHSVQHVRARDRRVEHRARGFCVGRCSDRLENERARRRRLSRAAFISFRSEPPFVTHVSIVKGAILCLWPATGYYAALLVLFVLTASSALAPR